MLLAIQVGDCKNKRSLGSIRECWFSWFLKVGFMGLALFGSVTSEERVEEPSSSLFCISECATCPVICSPPPPALLTYYSPPSGPSGPSPFMPRSPSPSYFTDSPPPPKLRPPPPPSPSSHSSEAAPPPPPPYKQSNSPPSGPAMPTVIPRPHDYSYPYYYFYASDASSHYLDASFSLLLLFLHRVIFY